jgi:glycosyltransferase involved in cell wall biosynthesis
VKRCSPDIIHCQAEVVPGIDHFVISGLRRCAGVVLTVHDPESMIGGRQVLPEEARRWRRADAIVVHSEQARRLVARHAPAVPVSVVAVDLNLSGSVMTRAEARGHLGLGNGPIALLLGFLRPYKGLALLASAWPAVAKENPEARLLLVGEPYPSDELDRLSALNGVELRSGFLPDEEIDTWAAAADVLVMPYDRGSHSGVLHRALAMGTPVLPGPAPCTVHWGPIRCRRRNHQPTDALRHEPPLKSTRRSWTDGLEEHRDAWCETAAFVAGVDAAESSVLLVLCWYPGENRAPLVLASHLVVVRRHPHI